ncbi:MAG: pentapeptide repeat-containing protein, partial [Okeania sp. SIO2D1]|nr:pentapeptide repeat-containing protein [Okeania sp. SIO2D1]
MPIKDAKQIREDYTNGNRNFIAIELPEVDLSGINLSGADFSNSDFSDA